MAFLGGLILNLMPCVFPVLSLKIIGLVNNRGKSQKHLLAHGLAFTFGILLTMTALAGALALVKQSGAAVGWGFQLQSPWFVAALFVLFIAITVNLLGLFEFTLGSRVSLGSSPASSKFSVGNSFATRNPCRGRGLTMHRAVYGCGLGLCLNGGLHLGLLCLYRLRSGNGASLASVDSIPDIDFLVAETRKLDGTFPSVPWQFLCS